LLHEHVGQLGLRGRREGLQGGGPVVVLREWHALDVVVLQAREDVLLEELLAAS
jgi:hypothetical protein